MRVSITSGLNSSWFQRHQPRSIPRLNGERPQPYHSNEARDIRLESNVRVELGSINGKPLSMTNTPYGGFGWTGSPLVQAARAGEKVSQEVIESARLASSYTRAESEHAYKIVTIVNGFYRLTQRTEPPLSIQGLNDLLKELAVDSTIVVDALGRMGVNANEEFSVNGQKLHFSGGRFVLGSSR